MTTIQADARAFSAALGSLIRVVQFRDRDRACCHDLSVSQCYALERTVRAGACTVNELAAELYLDKSTTSRVLNSLVDKGLVRRGRDPNDGRVVRLEATPSGVSLSEQIERELAAEYGGLLADFSPEVREAFTELLGRLGSAFARRVHASNGRCCALPNYPEVRP